MDEFAQSVKVHEVLGNTADAVRVRTPSAAQRNTMKRLSGRAKAVARSMMDRTADYPEAVDAIDEQLDDHVFEPNRRAIAKRSVALERWLADHGFRNGTPIRYVRSHRHLHHHGNVIELPVARPVIRESFHGVDEFLTDQILDSLHMRSHPAVQQTGRVSVAPGFAVLELSLPEFQRQFNITSDPTSIHGHVVVANAAVGPMLITTRDISGEMIAHALMNELTHEVGSMNGYRHVPSFPTPAQLLYRPERIYDIVPPYDKPDEIDRIAHAILAERLRHLPTDCRTNWPLTLNDLGFSPHDWVSIEESKFIGGLTQHVASVYLASILLGKVFIDMLNHHPEAYEEVGFFPAHAFADVQCLDGWHPHYQAANSYVNYVRTAKSGVPGPKFLDGLYRRVINPTRDFAHEFATHHPVRLHTYCGPLHPLD